MKHIRQSLFALGLIAASGSAGLLATADVASAAPTSVVQVQIPQRVAPSPRSSAIAQAATTALQGLNAATLANDEATFAQYVGQRDALAAEVAIEVGIEPQRMQQAWAVADRAHQAALLAALSQVGVPYQRNSSIEGEGFDCSGLTTFAWHAAGVSLYRQSRSQIQQVAPVSSAAAQAGDLVYYPGHVSMYLGVDRAIVHAVGRGRFVEIGHVRTGKSVKFGNPIG